MDEEEDAEQDGAYETVDEAVGAACKENGTLIWLALLISPLAFDQGTISRYCDD